MCLFFLSYFPKNNRWLKFNTKWIFPARFIADFVGRILISVSYIITLKMARAKLFNSGIWSVNLWLPIHGC